jgi:hypothetical protein
MVDGSNAYHNAVTTPAAAKRCKRQVADRLRLNANTEAAAVLFDHLG